MILSDAWSASTGCTGNFFQQTVENVDKAMSDSGQSFSANWDRAWSNTGKTYELAFNSFGSGNVSGGLVKFFEAMVSRIGNGLTLGGVNMLCEAVCDTDQVSSASYADSDTGVIQYVTKSTGVMGVLNKSGSGMANDQLEQEQLTKDDRLSDDNVSGLKILRKDAAAGIAVLVHDDVLAGNAALNVTALKVGSNDAKVLPWDVSVSGAIGLADIA